MATTHYKAFTDTIAKAVMKRGMHLNKKERAGADPLRVLAMVKNEMPFGPLELNILADEAAWRSNGRHVIVIDDLDTATLISDLSFKIEAVEGIPDSIPIPFFRLAVPSNFFSGPTHVTAANVSIYPVSQIAKIFQPLVDVGLMPRGPTPTDAIGHHISITHPIVSQGETSMGRSQ